MENPRTWFGKCLIALYDFVASFTTLIVFEKVYKWNHPHCTVGCHAMLCSHRKRIHIRSYHASGSTCSSWRCHTGPPPSRRSTLCSTTGSRPRRSGTASRRSSPAQSKMAFLQPLVTLAQRRFKWRLDTDWQTGVVVMKGSGAEKGRETSVRSLTCYLASQTKTAFKQRVLNSDLGWSARQAKLWKSKWSTPFSYN